MPDQQIRARIDALEQTLRTAFANASTPAEKQDIRDQLEALNRLRARLLVAATVAAAAELAGRVDALEKEIDALLDVPLFGGTPGAGKPAGPAADGGGTPADAAGSEDPPPHEPPLPADAGPGPTISKPEGFDGPHIVISATDLDALARVAQSEVAVFANYGKDQLEGGVAAVIDTIFNRVAHPSKEFPDTIEAVIDKPKQFSAINPLGSWTKLEAAKPGFFKVVESHVKARAAGAPSRIRGATHFLNPKSASQKAMNDWGAHLVANTVAWYGKWDAPFIHHHGFAPGYKPPPPHAIEYKGAISYFDGEGLPLARAMPSPGTSILPDEWKPKVRMDRVIVHWTGGAHTASGLDKNSYHILIEHDGNTVRGKFSIADNVSNLIWNPRNYAAHTKGANTRAIGVSVCCMLHAQPGPPLRAGKHPMTQIQWQQMIRVVAELCRTYAIQVTPRTVLGHGEVQANLGITQDGKWDPMILPWDTGLSRAQVGDLFRAEVSKLL